MGIRSIHGSRGLAAGAALALASTLTLAPVAQATLIGPFKATSKRSSIFFPNLCKYKVSGGVTGKGSNYTIQLSFYDKFGVLLPACNVPAFAGPPAGLWSATKNCVCGAKSVVITQVDTPGLGMEAVTNVDSVQVTELETFLLNGAQEIPPNASVAVGEAGIHIDPATNTITYDIDHNVAGATAAHIHGPAARDKNAGILINFPSVVSPMEGTLTYLEADEPALLAGRTYVNIHSGAFGAGEIRGQVPSSIDDVPSATEWGLVAMSLLLLALGTILIRRRRWAEAR